MKTENWSEMYKSCEKFSQQYGFGYIPHGINDELDCLHDWQSLQRAYYENGWLDADKALKLENIYVDLKATGAQWQDWYLMLYRVLQLADHDDGFITIKSTAADTPEKKWYHSQESGYRNNRLHTHKQKVLARLKFRFMYENIHDKRFREKCEELKEYIRKYDSPYVTPKTTGYESLGRWVSRMRYYYSLAEGSSRKLSKERVELCEEAGMVWKAKVRK